MNLDISLPNYKALIQLLVDEGDTLDEVIGRLLAEREETQFEEVLPVNQRDPGFWYAGRWYRSKNAIDVYVQFLEVLEKDTEEFFERFERRCLEMENSRPYIAKNKADLYPSKQKLQRYAKAVGNWWVDGNISNKQKSDLMKIAMQVAGLTYGVDVKISLPNAG